MVSDQVFETIMSLATIFGSSIGLILAGILFVAFLLRVLERTQGFLGRDTTAV